MKTAIITGISSGIGAAISERLVKEGWQVLGLTHDDVDLGDLSATAQAIDKLLEQFTPPIVLDALIHVAGVWHDHDKAHSGIDLEDYSPEQIVATMNVGVTSFMVLTSKFLPVMARDGCVIGVSGTFSEGASGWLPYYTSKRAQEDFLAGLSQDYPQGPRVYGISPAETATPQYEKFYPDEVQEAQPAAVVADATIKIILGEATYETGSIIQVRDGVASKGFHA